VEARLGQRIDGLDQRIDEVEERLDQRIDGVEERLGQRIDSLDQKIDDTEARLNERIERAVTEQTNILTKRLGWATGFLVLFLSLMTYLMNL